MTHSWNVMLLSSKQPAYQQCVIASVCVCVCVASYSSTYFPYNQFFGWAPFFYAGTGLRTRQSVRHLPWDEESRQVASRLGERRTQPSGQFFLLCCPTLCKSSLNAWNTARQCQRKGQTGRSPVVRSDCNPHLALNVVTVPTTEPVCVCVCVYIWLIEGENTLRIQHERCSSHSSLWRQVEDGEILKICLPSFHYSHLQKSSMEYSRNALENMWKWYYIQQSIFQQKSRAQSQYVMQLLLAR